MKTLNQEQREHICFLAGISPESLPEDASLEDIMTRFRERAEAELKLLKREEYSIAELNGGILANPVRYPDQEKQYRPRRPVG